MKRSGGDMQRERIEKQFRKINDTYNKFSYAVVAYDHKSTNKDMLKEQIRELKRDLNMFEAILN